MINRTLGEALLGTALLFGTAAPASADERLVNHAFNESEVIRVEGKMHVQATIIFGENETIENVAVGDSQSWQITPNKRANLLFLKPLSEAARTNMTVITDQHRYFFDLIASKTARPLYMLRFAYRDSAAHPGTTGSQAEGVRQVSPHGSGAAMPSSVNPATNAAIDTKLDPAMLNFAWKSSGDSKLVPQSIYDDGISTFLVWGERQPIPVILMRNDKGEEGPVNFAVRGSMIVITDVPGTLILRNGHARAMLRNDGRGTVSRVRGDMPRSPTPATIAASPPASALPSTDFAGR
ncbi:MAG: TrbG/VirB9 family P-type conjugative transfer protein [Novosphingobium sp.]